MTTYNISNPSSGIDLGNFEAVSAEQAIGAMMKDAGHGVFTSNHAGGDDYDTLTWDSDADADNDDGSKATTRATLRVVPVVK